MQRNECKPGTEVIIRGTIVADDGTAVLPIKVKFKNSSSSILDPVVLEPAQPKYDPARKYRKGDLVRITGFHGRIFGNGCGRGLSANNAIGDQVVLCENEIPGGDVSLPDRVLSNGNNYLSVACIELVKSVEEREEEEPYVVSCGSVEKRDGGIVVVFNYEKHGRDEANRMAQKVCDELNQEYKRLRDA